MLWTHPVPAPRKVPVLKGKAPGMLGPQPQRGLRILALTKGSQVWGALLQRSRCMLRRMLAEACSRPHARGPALVWASHQLGVLRHSAETAHSRPVGHLHHVLQRRCVVTRFGQIFMPVCHCCAQHIDSITELHYVFDPLCKSFTSFPPCFCHVDAPPTSFDNK
jgi:hypothetical protein